MSEHNKEPWQIMKGRNCFDVSDAEETPIAVMVGDEDTNARRIVACVNACAGVSNLFLEAVADTGGIAELEAEKHKWMVSQKELLEALKYLKHHRLLINSHAHAVTDAAITKAEQQ